MRSSRRLAWLSLLFWACTPSDRPHDPPATVASPLVGVHVTWAPYEVPQPINREAFAAAYDEVGHRVLAVRGGTGLETWAYSKGAWSRVSLKTPLIPQTVTDSSYAFVQLVSDPKRKVVVFIDLRPADAQGASSPPVWEFDGTDWNPRSSSPDAGAPEPPRRRRYSAAFDPVTEEVLVFGGLDAQTTEEMSDTWSWNGSRWRPLARGPSARHFAGMASDFFGREVILWGGAANPSSTAPTTGETWTWDGTSWRQAPGSTAPSPRVGPAMGTDRERNQVLLFGGHPSAGQTGHTDLWLWNGTRWTPAGQGTPPPNPGLGAMNWVFDPATRTSLLFRNEATSGVKISTWDGLRWGEEHTGVSPTFGQGVPLAYDEARQVIVAFSRDRVLEWDGRMFRAASPQTLPFEWGAAFYDSARKETIALLYRYPKVETWGWNGSVLKQYGSPVASAPQVWAGVAYDPKLSQAIMFGGRGSGGSGITAKTQVWDSATASWSERTPATAPSRRQFASLAFQPQLGRIVLFGGHFDNDAPDPKVWSWSGTDWSEEPLGPGDGTPGLVGSMATDSATGRVYYVTTQSSQVSTWQLDGSKWSRLLPDAYPPNTSTSSSFRLAHDAARGKTMLVAAFGTWLLSFRGGTCARHEDCPNAFCVDGVCCLTASCGTCQACNLEDPGRCTPLRGAEDPDSCPASQKQTCDARAVCTGGLGGAATEPSQCASGFVADGVCCDRKCDGRCEACVASLKESGAADGTCDVAKAGTDPRNSCEEAPASGCGQSGTCDGQGGCANYAKGTVCGPSTCTDNRATPLVCDGHGVCGVTPTGNPCGAYACEPEVGCKTRCELNTDCAPEHVCDQVTGTCTRSAVCVDLERLRTSDGSIRSCSPFACAGSACAESCGSVDDCAQGFVCDLGGRCTSPPPSRAEGCRMAVARAPGAPGFFSLGLLALLPLRRRLRARAEPSVAPRPRA